MKRRWNSVWIKLIFYPLDWLRLYVHWFRASEAAFIRVGPIEASFSWDLDFEADDCSHASVLRERHLAKNTGSVKP